MKKQGLQAKRKTKLQTGGQLLLDLAAVSAAVWLGSGAAAAGLPKNRLLPFILATFLLFIAANSIFAVYGRSVRLSPLSSFGALAASAGCAAIGQIAFERLFSWGITVKAAAVMGSLIFLYSLAGRAAAEKFFRKKKPVRRIPTAIYGAGELGQYLAARMGEDAAQQVEPVLFLDDDKEKQNSKILGYPVESPQKLREAVKRWNIEQVVIAINQPVLENVRQMVALCSQLRIPVKRFGMFDAVAELGAAKMGNIRVEQLLKRKDVQLDLTEVEKQLEGKTVLVTGGAGSIGSEICRQALRLGCRRLIVADIHENGLFYLDKDLKAQYPEDRYVLRVGSVQDKPWINSIMEQYRPDIVYHAAAHKHVPMMEKNPREAIKNNFLGTFYTAQAAKKWGAERFILISTDKAVNPSNIMGATKRMCELAVKALHSDEGTVFSAVRFGNVLGSVGSVVPVFKEQIEAGGPVTVTHLEMKRYFMTIPEAVSLVLDTGRLAKGGEVFVLDMGEPVKIYDLACQMIRLAGLEPGRDIEIQVTGVRPGEKLYEEIAMDDENTIKTENNQIYVNRSQEVDREQVLQAVVFFEQGLDTLPWGQIRQQVQALVPTYQQNV